MEIGYEYKVYKGLLIIVLFLNFPYHINFSNIQHLVAVVNVSAYGFCFRYFQQFGDDGEGALIVDEVENAVVADIYSTESHFVVAVAFDSDY